MRPCQDPRLSPTRLVRCSPTRSGSGFRWRASMCRASSPGEPRGTRLSHSLVNRYYDPASYQFLSIDPKVGTTLQPYAFVGGDPLNSTDPLGLSSGLTSSYRCASRHHCVKGHSWNVWSFLRTFSHRVRRPDFISWKESVPTAIPGFNFDFGLTLSKGGHVFGTGGFSLGVPGASSSLTAGWTDSSHALSESKVASLIRGPSLSGSAIVPVGPVPGAGGIGPAAGEDWESPGQFGSHNFATEVGVGVAVGRQASVGGSWTLQLPGQLPGILRW